MNDYIEQRYISGPESDPVNVLISNGEKNQVSQDENDFKPKVQIPTLAQQQDNQTANKQQKFII